jgi:siroheme synthase-like protein
MQDLIVALRIDGRRCLVIGGGDEAERRVRALLERGALVTWLGTGSEAPASERLSVLARPFDEADLDDAWLTVLTDRDRALARRIAAAAEARGRWFCAVDQASLGSFSHLALASAGPVQVAIGTGGAVPGLARRLRQELERVFGESRLGAFATALSRLRRVWSPAERRERLGPLLEGVRLTGALSVPPDPPDVP